VSPQPANANAGTSTKRKLITGGVIVAAVIGGFVLAKLHFRSPFGPADATAVKHTPLEFLYLDNTRVEAYLAELDRGTFAQQSLRHKETTKESAEVAASGAKAGSSSEAEDFIERVVTPTAASEFIELDDLLSPHDLVLDQSGSEGAEDDGEEDELQEGDFVRFQANSLRPPTYLNPYLAVQQAGTLSALFPMPSHQPAQRAVVERRREASRQFKKQVGEDPRVVFALQMTTGSETESAKVLLPLKASELTDERSLIKFGGGRFTVVGKVVRIFPEEGEEGIESGVNGRHGEPLAYVDSPTRETWEHPLENAPGELICRTSPKCVREVEERRNAQGKVVRTKKVGEERREAIRRTRQRMLTKLHNQTEIAKEGTVILPIAIYK
jgi:hypothetical protein